MLTYWKKIKGSCPAVPGNMHVKFEVWTLNVSELLALNVQKQKVRGPATMATSPFRKFLRNHVWTVSGNTRIKLEVRSFNRFAAISI